MLKRSFTAKELASHSSLQGPQSTPRTLIFGHPRPAFQCRERCIPRINQPRAQI